MTRAPHVALLLVLVASCAAERPAHFADAKVVVDVRDDSPVPMVKRREPVLGAALTEAYIERPVIAALDPTRAPDAGDVNALDVVPRSSWFSPADVEHSADADEPPAPPFRVLAADAVTRENAVAVLDRRGRRFEIWRDAVDRAEMATGAAAVASRLLRAVGYFTPGVWVKELTDADFLVSNEAEKKKFATFAAVGPPRVAGLLRAAITRWPIGADVGPTPTFGMRGDDANDKVPHEDRRTLRALKLVFGWLGMTQTDSSVLRDTYVGAPGDGHVVHYIAGLGGALGADAVVRARPFKDDDSDLADLNVWITLASLGLYPQQPRVTRSRWPAVGEYPQAWFPPAFGTSPPIAPMDRMLPADAFWAAKQIASIETPELERALDAGAYHDPAARSALLDTLRIRQAIAIRWGVMQVTSCEVERLEQLPSDHGAGAALLVLRDDAPSLGIVDPGTTIYRVNMVDQVGKRLQATTEVRLTDAAIFPVRLPATAPGYVVVHVLAIRPQGGPQRVMEVHLVHAAEWRVVGVVH